MCLNFCNYGSRFAFGLECYVIGTDNRFVGAQTDVEHVEILHSGGSEQHTSTNFVIFTLQFLKNENYFFKPNFFELNYLPIFRRS